LQPDISLFIILAWLFETLMGVYRAFGRTTQVAPFFVHPAQPGRIGASREFFARPKLNNHFWCFLPRSSSRPPNREHPRDFTVLQESTAKIGSKGSGLTFHSSERDQPSALSIF